MLLIDLINNTKIEMKNIWISDAIIETTGYSICFNYETLKFKEFDYLISPETILNIIFQKFSDNICYQSKSKEDFTQDRKNKMIEKLYQIKSTELNKQRNQYNQEKEKFNNCFIKKIRLEKLKNLSNEKI